MSCNVKNETTSDVETISFGEAIKTTFKDSNIGVVKCYKLVFNFKNKRNNIGFWILFSLVLAHIPFVVYYFIYNVKPIENFIFYEMKNNNYLPKKVNSPPKKKKKNIKKVMKIKIV